MRNMSFSMTTPQFAAKEKDVTRRDGWLFLEYGDVVMGIEKGQGLKLGERIRRIHPIRIVSVRMEPLVQLVMDRSYGEQEMRREGFPGMDPMEFINRWPDGVNRIVNRIEFEHIETHRPIWPEVDEPRGVFFNEYPSNWKAIAYWTKVLAGWRCVRCGHRDPVTQRPRGYGPCDRHCTHEPHEPLSRKKRVLTVHHLDGHKPNCRWWNLPALCQVCHLSVQARVTMMQRWPFEHSEWFKPYAAGYYAFMELRQDLSRYETEQRMEELLALGQPELA